ncbi:MAG: carboxylesterase/lipase family protein [Smithella sp.]
MKKNFTILIIFILLVSGNSAAISADRLTDVVKLDSGSLRGKYEDGMGIFLGIPYAAPPVRKFRWMPPKAVAPWKQVRNCMDFGPSCPQPGSQDGNKFNEDCLYLNVWTTAKPTEKLPVMVWIHGGAFNNGSTSQMEYDVRNLAKKGVVVVTINYRLGPLGFLVHPSLSRESSHKKSGNYGLLDQIAALKWVQKNIVSFGGNPGTVTIFGQGSGASSVMLLITSPLAAGLFHRAIAQSGNLLAGSEFIYPAFNSNMIDAIKTGEKFAAKLGCNEASNVAKALRKKSAREIIAAADFQADFCNNGLYFGPVFDGWVLPVNPLAAYENGKQLDVPIIAGSTSSESVIYRTCNIDWSLKKYKEFLKSRFGDDSEKALNFFPAKNDKDVRQAVDNVITVADYACPARFVARWMAQRKSRSYLYQFTRRPDKGKAGKLGIYHGSDLPYVFGNLNKSEGYNDLDVELSEKMMAYWVNFAKTGNPNGRGLFYWPGYKSESDINLEFGDTIQTNKNLFQKECDFVDRMFHQQFK